MRGGAAAGDALRVSSAGAARTRRVLAPADAARAAARQRRVRVGRAAARHLVRSSRAARTRCAANQLSHPRSARRQALEVAWHPRVGPPQHAAGFQNKTSGRFLFFVCKKKHKNKVDLGEFGLCNVLVMNCFDPLSPISHENNALKQRTILKPGVAHALSNSVRAFHFACFWSWLQ